MAILVPDIDENGEPLNEFDMFVREQAKEAEAVKPPDAFDLFVERQADADDALSSSLDQALEDSPDQAGKVKELSSKSGFPEEAVRSDEEAVRRQLRKDEIFNLFQKKPSSITREFLSDPATARVAHDEAEDLVEIETKARELGFFEEIQRDIDVGFERGKLTRQLGFLGARRRAGQEVSEEIADIEAKLPELKGSKGFIEAAANVVGVMAAGIPEAIAKGEAAAIGGATAAAIAGQAGPQAAIPEEIITVPAAASVGFTTGAGSEIFRQTAIIEGGLLFNELVDEDGLPEEVARQASEIAGLINGTLEVASFGIIGAPVKKLVKNIVVNRVTKKLAKTAAGAAAKKFSKKAAVKALREGVKDFGKVVAQETAVETLQENVGIGASEVSKAIEGKPLRLATPEGRAEIAQQNAEIIKETMKAMTILGGVPVGMNVVVDVARASRAAKNEKVIKEVSKKVKETKLKQRDFQTAVDFEASLLEEKNIEDIFIPAEKFREFAETVREKEGRDIVDEMNVTDRLEQAEFSGGDVRLSTRQYAEFVSSSESFDSVSEHIRLGENEMTAVKAKEFESEELQEQLDELDEKLEEDKAPEEVVVERKTPVIGEEPTAVPTSVLRDERNVLFSSDILDRKTVGDTASVEKFENLKKSIEKNGINKPVVLRVDESGKVNVVDGANRLLAAEELGIPNVPAVFTADSVKSGTAQKFAETVAPRTPTPGSRGEGVSIAEQAKQDVELAEIQAGTQALFGTAEELGQGEKTFESYLKAVKQNKDGAIKRETLRREKAVLKNAVTALDKVTKEIREEVAEEVKNRPEYRAMDLIKQGGKLDQDAIFQSDFLGEPFDLETLDKFPKIGNKKIFGPAKEGADVFHPDVLADIVGLPDGDTLLQKLFNLRPIQQVINEEADALAAERFPELPQRIKDLEFAIESLFTDNTAEILTTELNALRGRTEDGKPTKIKKVKASFVKARAMEQLRSYKLKDISTAKFVSAANRFGRQAGRLLREGKREEAGRAKFQQLTNFFLAQEAFKIREKIRQQNKFLNKAVRKPSLRGNKADKLPVDYSIAINGILNSYGLKGKPFPGDFDINEFHARETEQGILFNLPEPGNPEIKPSELTFHQWNSLVQDIKTIHHLGKAKAKVIKNNEKAQAQDVVDELIVNINKNLQKRTRRVVKDPVTKVEFSPISEDVLDNVTKVKDSVLDTSTELLLNMDTLLREIDGWEDLGPAYQAIKGGIDRAMSSGFNPGQVGFIERNKQIVETVQGLVKKFYTPKEQSQFHRNMRIPGISRVFTRGEIIAILLNSGNEQNILALEGDKKGKGKVVSREEIQIIRENVPLKDLEFAQAMLDYIDSFWEEISESTIRRKNFKPEKVIAQPFEAQGKTFRGGYYPLRYTGDSLALNDAEGIDALVDEQLTSGFTVSHTQEGHIKKRTSSGGRTVALDPFVAISHLERVAYDLEVGEALEQSYKILHHKDLTNAFAGIGRDKYWQAMDLWFRDVVAGEIKRGDAVNRALQHIRTGITISSLGYNIGVAALQPLGVFQSAIALGKQNTTKALLGTIGSIATGGTTIFKEIGNATPLMQQREATFNTAVAEAKRVFNQGFFDKGPAGKFKKALEAGAFLFIAKAQRFTDVVTWQAAFAKGMEKFHNNDVKAKEFADLMVERTQGSSKLTQRTAFERGTISKNVSQSETIRSFTLFMNFFAAKNNLVYERTKRTNFKNPFETINWAVDMSLAFVWETLAAMLIRGQWPDEDEDIFEKSEAFISEIFGTMTQGIPLLREAVSAARGFEPGGTVGRFAGDLAKLWTQTEQALKGEGLDENFYKALLRVFGIVAHKPTGQVIKTGSAIYDDADGEDVDWIEYMMGPKFDKQG